MEYKDYIEQWIHEIKTPVTAMKLLCENHRSDLTKELLPELEKTNRFTEQALSLCKAERAYRKRLFCAGNLPVRCDSSGHCR